MKTTKQIGVVVSIAILVLFSACNNNASQQDAAKDAALRDSLEQVKLDSLKQVKIDSIAKIKEDSIRQDSIRRNRVTPDLALFELKGPVKSVNKGYIIVGTDNGAAFDQNGNITYINKSRDGFTYKAKRKNGIISKLTSYDSDFGEEVYSKITYNSNNKPIKNVFYAQNYGGTNVISYANGNISSVKFSGGGDYDTNSNDTYTYIEFDQYGNWTKRTCTTKSTIYAFDSKDVMSSNKNTETQTRKITYYE